MSIVFSCPSCDGDVKVRDDLSGRKVKCPECREVVKVPDEVDDEAEVSVISEESGLRTDDDEDRPRKKRRRPRDDNDDEDRPRRLSHQAKVGRLLKDMERRGVSRGTAAPPLFRLMWALGIPIPPPFFLGFLANMLIMGIPAGLGWGVGMWLLRWRTSNLPAGIAFLSAMGFGLLFGLFMAFYMQWKARGLKLPPWRTYPERSKPKASVGWIIGQLIAILVLLGIGGYFGVEAIRKSQAEGGVFRGDDFRPPYPVDAWKSFSTQDGDFQVLMPGVPRQQDAWNQVLGNRIRGRDFFVTQREFNGIFSVTYFDYPENAPELTQPDAVFAKLRDNFLNSIGKNQLVSERKVTLQGQTGREIVVDSSLGPTKSSSVQQYYLVGRRQYRVYAGGSDFRPDTPDVRKFFESFQFTKTTAPR